MKKKKDNDDGDNDDGELNLNIADGVEDEDDKASKVNNATYNEDEGWGDEVNNSALNFLLHVANLIGNDDDPIVRYDHILKISNGKLNKLWILLDNYLTAHVFCNSKLLRNIRKVKKGLTIHSTEKSQ